MQARKSISTNSCEVLFPFDFRLSGIVFVFVLTLFFFLADL